MASLPPLSCTVFTEKVLENKATAAATAAKASYGKPCEICDKIYYSENAYRNHLASQKHRINEFRHGVPAEAAAGDGNSVISSAFSLGEPIGTGEPTETGEVDVVGESVPDSDRLKSVTNQLVAATISTDQETKAEKIEDESELAQKDMEAVKLSCLFCNYRSPTLPLNVKHMQVHHSLFIPEQKYLVDLDGLVECLYRKIWDVHQCILCGKRRQTAGGVQTHMRDMGHCSVAFTTEDEMLSIGDYYDFRSTYSDEEGDDDDSSEAEDGGLSNKQQPKRHDAAGGGAADDAEDAWESDSSLSSVPTDEITAVPLPDQSHRYQTLYLNRHHSHGDHRPHHSTDGWHSHAHHVPHAVYYDDYELHLPSGRAAGHRSLARYYKQNLHNYNSGHARIEHITITEKGAEPLLERGRQLIGRGSGGMGMLGVSESKRKLVEDLEKRHRRRLRRLQSHYQGGNEKRGNNQKHFRVSFAVVVLDLILTRLQDPLLQ